MAQFGPAYELTKKQEGGYANHPSDKGGETYAGIARNHNPGWPGWHIIDRYKQAKTLQWNEKIWDRDLISMVEDFYEARFNTIRADELKWQSLANLYFDFHVHSGRNAITKLQQAINDLSFPNKIMVDGKIGPQTIAAANKLDPAKLHDRYKQRRKGFFESIIERDPGQEVFKAGWFARLDQFPDLLKKKT